jgi:hypothetical protein
MTPLQPGYEETRHHFLSVPAHLLTVTDTHTESRQADRQTGRQADRQTGRQADREYTGSQTQDRRRHRYKTYIGQTYDRPSTRCPQGPGPLGWTHIRVNLFPDGGVCRLRARGVVRLDSTHVSGLVDLAAAETGGDVASLVC